MKKKKHPADLNQLALSIVGFATEKEIQPEPEVKPGEEKPAKNPAAVALGRLLRLPRKPPLLGGRKKITRKLLFVIDYY